jgi:hypothetical protein
MKLWQNRLALLLIWLVAGWVVWDFLEWIDPPLPRDTVAHPLRISPGGSDGQS